MKYIEKEERPWGSFFVIHDEKTYKLKRIEVKPGQRLSYQYHLKRAESWNVVKGSGVVTIEDKNYNVSEGKTILVPRESKHRVYNNSDDLLVLIEVQTGTYFGEDDIIRVSDDYNRK